MYTLTVNYPNLSSGEPVFIDGIGDVPNGKTVEVSAEQAENFRQAHWVMETKTPPDGGPPVTEPHHRTLFEAFRDNEFVTVKSNKSDSSTKGAQSKTDGGEK